MRIFILAWISTHHAFPTTHHCLRGTKITPIYRLDYGSYFVESKIILLFKISFLFMRFDAYSVRETMDNFLLVWFKVLIASSFLGQTFHWTAHGINHIPCKGCFTLEDEQIVSEEQIVWCAKETNEFFDEQIVWYLTVWKDDFSKTICPSRRTSRRQYVINSHQTDKCQTICPSRRFVCPLVWKRPMTKKKSLLVSVQV